MSRFKLSFLSGVFLLLFAICILLLPGCAKDVAKPNPIPSVDTTVYTTVNFNDLLLDSMFVDTFFVKWLIPQLLNHRLVNFIKEEIISLHGLIKTDLPMSWLCFMIS
ncbi:MAG: hypothetical protein IPO33_05525 [Saprospiraceae bacterium]|nr:hypothetical protein [Candidatus Brachybacter algidus]